MYHFPFLYAKEKDDRKRISLKYFIFMQKIKIFYQFCYQYSSISRWLYIFATKNILTKNILPFHKQQFGGSRESRKKSQQFICLYDDVHVLQLLFFFQNAFFNNSYFNHKQKLHVYEFLREGGFYQQSAARISKELFFTANGSKIKIQDYH